jgi:phosphoglycerol transferase MdoB-like AlkP superfamily enzyme
MIKIPKLIRWIFATGIIFLLLMFLLRIALFWVFSSQGNSFSGVFPSFILGFRYDIRIISIVLGLLLLAGSLPFLHPFETSRGRQTALFLTGLTAFLLAFFYAVDFAHYSYLSQRLSASVLNYLVDTGISASMVWQTYPVFRIVLLLLVGAWGIQKLVKMSLNRIRKAPAAVVTRRSRTVYFVLSILLLGLGIFGRVGQYPLRWSDAFALGSDYKAALALNPFESFFSSLKFRHSGYSEARIRKELPALAPYYGFATGDSLNMDFGRDFPVRKDMITTRPNVVVVICESFSAYKSSMWGNPLNTTPFFDGLCKQGLFFDHCFTPSYGTARGVWAVITGIPDVEVNTTTSSRNPAAVDQRTIINNFEGYDKFYFLGGSTSWANIRGLLTNNIKGLHLFEQQDYDAPKIDVWGISDKNLFLEANKRLREQDKPFFAVIQTADNHRPYTIPKEDQQEFQPVTASRDSLQKCGFGSNDEMNAFRYTDFCYRKFIEAASKEKYFRNTVFLFVGDHGIAGDAGAMFPRAWTDQHLTMEHVPLLIYSPALIAPRRVTALCSQVDVLPTLAGLCGVPYRNTTLGRDLTDTANYAGKDFSFIYDPDGFYIGVVKNGYFYRKQFKTGKEEIVSVLNNDPVPASVAQGPVKDGMQHLAEGIYETAKYMLLKNKK